jgi:hypothetical protein
MRLEIRDRLFLASDGMVEIVVENRQCRSSFSEYAFSFGI